MRILIQRVNSASVSVSEKVIAEIGQGLLLLLGFGQTDTEEVFPKMIEKVLNMRLFPDERGRFDQSVLELKGQVLLVPQFTLYSDCKKGRRPDFTKALEPEKASMLFDKFVHEISKSELNIETGEFGAYMKVRSENDGPVTIMLDSSIL